MNPQLTYYYDYNCPYCFLSSVMIDQLSREMNFELNLVVWKLPDDAIVDPKPENYKIEGAKFADNMGNSLGIEIQFDSPRTGTRAALEATKVAKDMGKESEFFFAVFREKWIEGKDISNHENLINIAEQIGLDRQKFSSAFLGRQGKQAVDEDFQRCINEKIWTIPVYNNGDETIQIHHFKNMPSLDQLRNFIKLGESFK